MRHYYRILSKSYIQVQSFTRLEIIGFKLESGDGNHQVGWEPGQTRPRSTGYLHLGELGSGSASDFGHAQLGQLIF